MSSDLKDIKSRFEKLGAKVQSLKNTKIGLESEIKTINSNIADLEEQAKSLTGKETFDEVKTYYEEKKEELETKSVEVSSKIDEYLKTVDGGKKGLESDGFSLE